MTSERFIPRTARKIKMALIMQPIRIFFFMK
jgi:hypothetical protein